MERHIVLGLFVALAMFALTACAQATPQVVEVEKTVELENLAAYDEVCRTYGDFETWQQ